MLKIGNPDNFRKNIVNKFEEIFDDEKKCINLEKGVFNYAIKEANSRKIIKKWENPYFAQIYVDRLRSIYLNLKKPELLAMIKNDEITPQVLAFMTHQEMDHEHWRVMIDRKIKRDASKFTTNVQASTDMFTCRKCKSKRSTFYELQTRSADEPATIFITCLDCGKQSKRS
jgi:DNA-directed RNA polymerase subunit M/transcription elongation factor TFIIS